jgi:uncharacterized protein (TIGR03435 family)
MRGMKRTLLVPGLVVAATATLLAQASRPAFDVVSIKSNRSLQAGGGIAPPRGGINATNMPVLSLIGQAYELRPYQVVGGPDWIRTEKFDVIGRSDQNPQWPQLRLMLQTMLADRFKLTVHREKRDLTGYRLVVIKEGALGAGLKPAVSCAQDAGRPRAECGIPFRTGELSYPGVPIQRLADTLVAYVGGVIVDRTNLSGFFDIQLRWTPEFERRFGDPASAPIATDAPPIFTAVQEQLGLRLEPQRVPTEVLVIDSIEKPTEN